MVKQSGPMPIRVDYQYEKHGYEGEGPRRSHPALRAAVVLAFAAVIPVVGAVKPAWSRLGDRPVARGMVTLAPEVMTGRHEPGPEPRTVGVAELPTPRASQVR